jgi:endonuclease YncB( thermonuclease family)
MLRLTVRPSLLSFRLTLVIAGLLALLPAGAHAKPVTRVYLNGLPAPVYFTDGDSFTVLNGAYTGLKTRLSGFNTLESFGPVHHWGSWDPRELNVIAKMATLNARRGVWHCYSDLRRDGYGRALWFCPDLALDQVRKGLGHAMTVTGSAASPELLVAQREAMAEKRGLWAKGVPTYIVTSVHSVSEGYSDTYNRLIATSDGHTEQWRHKDNYAVCLDVCHPSGACMRYVPFEQRYGEQRAACLRPDFDGGAR